MRRLWLSGLVGLVLMLGGCGSAGDAGLSEEASAALSDHMTAVRGAVADEEPAAAQQALDALHAEARNRARAGEISSQRLAAIGTAVDDVERWLDEVDAEPEPQPEPEEAEPDEPEGKPEEPEPEEPEPEDPDPDPDPGEGNNGDGNGNGEGNGNGNDKDEESDGDGDGDDVEEEPAEDN